MKPTNFNKARWHYCQIVTALVCDDAINAGIIAESHVTPLLFFFILAWKNDKIRKWICHGKKDRINDRRMIMLIGFLYDTGLAFSSRCRKTSIGRLLVHFNVFSKISNQETVKNYMKEQMSKVVQEAAYEIFSEIWKTHQKNAK